MMIFSVSERKTSFTLARQQNCGQDQFESICKQQNKYHSNDEKILVIIIC